MLLEIFHDGRTRSFESGVAVWLATYLPGLN